MIEFEISTIEEWNEIVDKILCEIKHPILLLKGNLGAGKTTFTQMLLKKLESTDSVSSPTYSIVNEYETPKGKVFHFDLYRVNDIEELFDIGIDEYLENGFLSIIEWPQIYQEELDELNFHEMNIENIEGKRKISFK